MMNSWGAPVIQQLLADEHVALSGFPHADAFVALYPFLNKVIVPRGVTDLARDQPPADVTLIATKTTLVVRQDLHPALQYLLLNAATEIHSRPSIFNRANEFPAAEAIDMPLSSEAARFYKSGLPFLLDYFPFWMAELLGKLIILLIPILGVLYPMMRFLPGLYDWAMRSKSSAHLRRAEALGRRNGKRPRQRARHARGDCAARPPGGAGKPPQSASHLCEHAVHVAKSYRPRARRGAQASRKTS